MNRMPVLQQQQPTLPIFPNKVLIAHPQSVVRQPNLVFPPPVIVNANPALNRSFISNHFWTRNSTLLPVKLNVFGPFSNFEITREAAPTGTTEAAPVVTEVHVPHLLNQWQDGLYRRETMVKYHLVEVQRELACFLKMEGLEHHQQEQPHLHRQVSFHGVPRMVRDQVLHKIQCWKGSLLGLIALEEEVISPRTIM